MLNFSLLSIVLLAAPALAELNTLCDDGGPLTCMESDSRTELSCGDTNGLVALQNGCFLCVNPTTCVSLGPVMMQNTVQDIARPLPKANGNDISVLLQDQADSPEESAYEQGTALYNAKITVQMNNESVEKRQEISNWWFSVPGCLAVVSVGLAFRSRVSSRGFERLQDRNEPNDLLFQDDINPFCSNKEEIAIEMAGEDEQFLPSTEVEEDEFTKAESQAIKQAVLLHIKEFDAEEVEI